MIYIYTYSHIAHGVLISQRSLSMYIYFRFMYSKQSKWLAASCLSRIIMLRIGSCTPFFSLHLDLTPIGWMSEWMNGWMDERTNARKNDWMNGVIIQSIQQPLNHSIDQPIINRSDNWTGVCIFGFCNFNMCLFTFSACVLTFKFWFWSVGLHQQLRLRAAKSSLRLWSTRHVASTIWKPAIETDAFQICLRLLVIPQDTSSKIMPEIVITWKSDASIDIGLGQSWAYEFLGTFACT